MSVIFELTSLPPSINKGVLFVGTTHCFIYIPNSGQVPRVWLPPRLVMYYSSSSSDSSSGQSLVCSKESSVGKGNNKVDISLARVDTHGKATQLAMEQVESELAPQLGYVWGIREAPSSLYKLLSDSCIWCFDNDFTWS